MPLQFRGYPGVAQQQQPQERDKYGDLSRSLQTMLQYLGQAKQYTQQQKRQGIFDERTTAREGREVAGEARREELHPLQLDAYQSLINQRNQPPKPIESPIDKSQRSIATGRTKFFESLNPEGDDRSNYLSGLGPDPFGAVGLEAYQPTEEKLGFGGNIRRGLRTSYPNTLGKVLAPAQTQQVPSGPPILRPRASGKQRPGAIQPQPQQQPQAGQPGVPQQGGNEQDLVQVINPQGKPVNIRRSQLQQALAKGYRLAR